MEPRLNLLDVHLFSEPYRLLRVPPRVLGERVAPLGARPTPLCFRRLCGDSPARGDSRKPRDGSRGGARRAIATVVKRHAARSADPRWLWCAVGHRRTAVVCFSSMLLGQSCRKIITPT